MIDILLATYNGEKYLKEQLDSLKKQTLTDFKVLIHDDGSNDQTIKIINEFLEQDERFQLINDNIKFGNAGANFLHLLQFSTSEFIMFCDQDDIWLENKIEKLFNVIKDKKGINAVYCNAYAYDGEKIIAQKVSLIERDNLSNSLFLNSGVQGCSLMFNRKLLELALDFPSYIYMHDHYITMLAVAFGKLYYIDESLMLYRQHTSNVTGNVPITILDRFKTLVSRQSVIIDRKHYLANKSLFEKFHEKLNLHDQRLFKDYLDFPTKKLFQKFYSILKYNFKIGNSSTILFLKLFIKKTIN